VDDLPWKVEFDDLVVPPVFSPDGRRVAAAVRSGGRWTIAVDGTVWHSQFDMVWDPVFTPESDRVLAKVERDGRFAIALDGTIWSPWFDALWEPVVSPDGTRVLLRAVEGGTYYRQVVPMGDAFPGRARE
jgi:hypothetical protein